MLKLVFFNIRRQGLPWILPKIKPWNRWGARVLFIHRRETFWGICPVTTGRRVRYQKAWCENAMGCVVTWGMRWHGEKNEISFIFRPSKTLCRLTLGGKKKCAHARRCYWAWYGLRMPPNDPALFQKGIYKNLKKCIFLYIPNFLTTCNALSEFLRRK